VLLTLANLPGPPEVCLFMFGAVFHQSKRRIPFSGKLALLALGLTAVAFRLPPSLQFVLPFTLPYLVFYVVYHPRLKLHAFGKRADLSYGIYLWGWPVEQMLVRLFEPQLNGLLLFLLALPLTSILALASWKLVEAPFLRLKRRPVLNQVTAAT
jgi:peptidoglycan/LPS O-acetylase OafA/YrhL